MSWYNEVVSKEVLTPCYVYHEAGLRSSFDLASSAANKHNIDIHFAIKANHRDRVLKLIQNAGFGVECVSGGEIKQSLISGFNPNKIGMAGSAKSDKEIELAIVSQIGSLHVESLQELAVIEEIAAGLQQPISVLLRLNPNIDAETHANIRTGTEEDKFGIPEMDWEACVAFFKTAKWTQFEGLHYHVGSQVLNMDVFRQLVKRSALDCALFESLGLAIHTLNLGGGLGINYANPSEHPPFEEYFNAIGEARAFFRGKLIVELGRSLVGQHAVLLTKVLFTKGSEQSPKVLVDAGMTDLARPALYQAYHDIENVLSNAPMQEQNVFGPICESSDCFAKKRVFPKAKRGDILAIHSVGAYGETMQSGYNLRDKCPVIWIQNNDNGSTIDSETGIGDLQCS